MNINDGDIITISIGPKSTLIDRAIAFWEGFDIFHAGIAVIIRDIPFLLQMDPKGNNLVPLSDYDLNPIHILKKPKSVIFDKEKALRGINTYQYSYEGALKAGISQYLPGIFRIKRSKRKKFCSQYCIDIWKEGGFIWNTSDIIDPADLEFKLINRSIEVIKAR